MNTEDYGKAFSTQRIVTCIGNASESFCIVIKAGIEQQPCAMNIVLVAVGTFFIHS